MQVNITCSNRFSSLVDEDVYVGSEPNIDVVRQEACEVQRVGVARKLKIATWNCVVFSPFLELMLCVYAN